MQVGPRWTEEGEPGEVPVGDGEQEDLLDWSFTERVHCGIMSEQSGLALTAKRVLHRSQGRRGDGI